MALFDEEQPSTQAQVPSPSAAMLDAIAAATAIQMPGVSPRSISPAAEANKDLDHLMGVGGDRTAAEAKVADDHTRTGSITGLVGTNTPRDVVQISNQNAAAETTNYAIAQASPKADAPSMPSAAASSLKEASGSAVGTMADSMKDAASAALANLGQAGEAIKGAIAGLGDSIKATMTASAEQVPEAKLGTGTPPPAAVVPPPALEPQQARA